MGDKLAAGVQVLPLLKYVPEYLQGRDAGPPLDPYWRDDHCHHCAEQRKRQSDSLQPVKNEGRCGAPAQRQVGEEPCRQEER